MQRIKSKKTFGDIHQFLLAMLKWSGFAFFSTSVNSQNVLEFKQNASDIAIFIISLVVSLMTLFNGNTGNIFKDLKSPILWIGSIMLVQISLITVIFTRVFNFIASRRAFKFLVEIRKIDEKVCCSMLLSCDNVSLNFLTDFLDKN